MRTALIDGPACTAHRQSERVSVSAGAGDVASGGEVAVWIARFRAGSGQGAGQ